ncbi:50S ribosomal protein L29 [Gammaproteobacteria bacterium LSUCC0057]|uniref:Large ribosomal subunit protein uL29 n=1 Tax=Gammaproteobacteria bacterium LSUCC0057 TaxID=2559237 RepID=A0A4Y8UHK6_9GAMM|nr:50S ribosomal protein L29 [Gammaproteobacteria bacterium LSUCC0057]
MKASELRDKSREELQAALNSELEKQFKQRMQLATGQLKETHTVQQVRRNIARIKTVLNQKAGE